MPVRPGYLQQHNGSGHALPAKAKHHLRPLRIEPIDALSESETMQEYCFSTDDEDEDADNDPTGNYALLAQQCLAYYCHFTAASCAGSHKPLRGAYVASTPRYITQRVLRI